MKICAAISDHNLDFLFKYFMFRNLLHFLPVVSMLFFLQGLYLTQGVSMLTNLWGVFRLSTYTYKANMPTFSSPTDGVAQIHMGLARF